MLHGSQEMLLQATILIVDDEKNTREGLKAYLDALNFDVMVASNAEEALALYEKEKPDLILSDVRMPGMDGTELLEKVQGNPKNKSQVILMTAYGTVEDAVKAMKRGAYYYLTKPVNMDELEFLVKKALTSQKLHEENRELRDALTKERYEAGEIIGSSDTVKNILRTVDQVANSTSSVLIEGESGTGKELIAHRIHTSSPRKDRPFVAVHCAALTDSLLTSELFGHEKGSFTGANERKIGRFEKAHGGTLFLDEIAEISADAQVKLLRVLQESEFERVGGSKTIKVDVRLVFATNKNLIEEVKKGSFREDLYYRINVIHLKVPALRERKDDIPTLVKFFLTSIGRSNGKSHLKISKSAMDALIKYDWPGNIRELRNIIERMIVLSSSDFIDLKDIPSDLLATGDESAVDLQSTLESSNLQDMEKELIRKALFDCHGNKSMAAKKLGISRRTLYRKLEEYGIDA